MATATQTDWKNRSKMNCIYAIGCERTQIKFTTSRSSAQNEREKEVHIVKKLPFFTTAGQSGYEKEIVQKWCYENGSKSSKF